MHCNYCQNQFNHTINVPRLLIFCGHSLCENCCITLHSNNRVQCPECLSNTFIEDISFLPKNLALLKVNEPPSNSLLNCLKHDKKIQAYCEKEKILLCVDCILQDGHRTHSVDSIKNCYNKEQTKLDQMINKLETSKKGFESKFSQNRENQQTSVNNYHSVRKNLIGFYQQLKEIIQKDEETILKKIQEQFNSSENAFNEKNIEYKRKIEEVDECLRNFSTSVHENQIAFLAGASTRDELFKSVNLNAEDAGKVFNLAFSKNHIGDGIMKNIEKNFKTHINNLSSSNSSQVHKKTESSTINHVKPVRPKTSTPCNQNQKTFPKKMVKKEGQAQHGIGQPINIQHKISQESRKQSIKESRESRGKDCQKNRPLSRYDMNNKCEVSAVDVKESLFNSFMSNMTSFLTDKKYLYLVGGFSEDCNNIMKLNLSNLTWEKVSSLTSNRSKFGAINLEKDIFVFGGKKGKQRVSDCEVWNSSQIMWQTGFKLKRCRSGFGTVCVDGVVYVIGGNDGQNILASVETFNIVTGEWKKKEPMNEARDELAVCMGKDNKIYAIGGFGTKNQQPLKTVQAYDIKEDKWYPAPCLQTARRALAAAPLADGIYAIGGYSGSDYLASVQKYEEGSHEWVEVASLKKARCTHSAASVFDSQEILVSGGFDQGPLDSIEKYSLITNEWQTVASMPQARFMHNSLLISE